MLVDCAVIVPSCDGYRDVWPPFFALFWQRWADCPYPVYLGCGDADYADTRVATIRIGADVSWCANLQRYLDRVPAEWVILFLDDFLLTRRVDTGQVERMVALARQRELGCLRLRAAPPPTRPVRGIVNVGEIVRGEPYRASTQVAVWKTAFLRRLAHPNLSVWEFEHWGTLISDRQPDSVWGVYEDVISYRHGVERGKWRYDGIEICRRAGVEPDLAARSAATPAELQARLSRDRAAWKSQLSSVLPAPMRRFLRRVRPRRGLARFLPCREKRQRLVDRKEEPKIVETP